MKKYITLALVALIAGCGDGDGTRIEATGTIEATDVTVSAQVAGTVVSLRTDEGLKVGIGDTLVILVWDNAPCHRPKIHREIPGLIVLFLPPYSPELNPAERFFEELRKATACRIFKTIEEQETVIERKLIALTNDTEAMKQLTGYRWIQEQCGGVN